MGVRLSWLVFLLGTRAIPLYAQGVLDPQVLVLRPGDVVRVEIWREEGLSGDFHVDAQGKIVLPLLGEFLVEGRPWGEIREQLLDAYRRELRNPSIRLTPLRRVHILGEVRAPGLYAVDPTLSLLGAIALAGGADPQGDLKNLRLIRNGRVVLNRVPGETALGELDVRSGDEIFVGRRGWVERNSTFLVSALLSLTSIVVAIASR